MTEFRGIWATLLQGQAPRGPEYHIQFVGSTRDARLFASVNAADHSPGLLVELSEVRRAFREVVTRTFHLISPKLTGLPEGHWALVIELKDPDFIDLFATLARDVAQAILEAAPGRVVNSVVRCVERWRHFVENRKQPLSDAEVRGLLGELSVLSRCIGHLGSSMALASWSGPDGALRDFELPSASLEVKAYQGEDAATVIINAPDQLDAVQERPVFLCAVRVTLSADLGITLGECATRVLDLVAGDVGAQDRLEDLLARAGYMFAHKSLYTQKFVLGPIRTYTVSPGFPRIRSADVPYGVIDVRFGLSLAALNSFEVDTSTTLGDRFPAIESGQ